MPVAVKNEKPQGAVVEKQTAPKDKKRKAETVKIPPLKLQVFNLTIEGDSEFISHAWSAKAKKQMLDKQMKKAAQEKEARDPEVEYRDSMYLDDRGRPCMLASAIKQAAVDACSHIDGITKVTARGAFFIMGDRLPITGKPRMREDMARIARGTAMLRYRAEFPVWSVSFTVRYNASVISAEQIINLINVAGFAIGVGDWRPQKNGNHGMFHVKEGRN